MLRSLSYRWCLIVLLLSPLLAFGWYWYGVTSATYQANQLQVIPFRGGDAQGEAVVERGDNTIWLTGPYVSIRRNTATEYRQVLSVEVRDCGVSAADAASVPVRRIQSQVFNVGGREGRSLWAFKAARRGPHCIAVTGSYDPEASIVWPRAVAVGEGVGLRVQVRPWVAVIFVSGLVVATALGVRTYINRRRLVNSSP